MTRPFVVLGCCVTLAAGLSACTNPYDPAQRFVGGGLIGAGTGAAIGAAAAGGPGAATGALVGGLTGAVAGVATTPPPPGYYGYRGRYYAHSHRRHRHHRQVARRTSANPPAN